MWRTIDTAPSGKMDDYREQVVLVVAHGFIPVIAYKKNGVCWMRFGAYDERRTWTPITWTPTHWMPLPPRPSIRETIGDHE